MRAAQQGRHRRAAAHGWTLAGAPWPIPAYAVTHVPTFVVRDVPDGTLATVLVALALLALLLGFLWRGSRITWTILLLIELASIATQPFDSAPWWAFALSVVGLALLVLPATRRFVWGAAPHRAPA